LIESLNVHLCENLLGLKDSPIVETGLLLNRKSSSKISISAGHKRVNINKNTRG